MTEKQMDDGLTGDLKSPRAGAKPREVRDGGIFADWSFGLRARENGGIMHVWFCGGPLRPRNGVAQDICAHTSRADARRCGVEV